MIEIYVIHVIEKRRTAEQFYRVFHEWLAFANRLHV